MVLAAACCRWPAPPFAWRCCRRAQAQFIGAPHVDNLSVLDDRHTVAQPLGFLHQMCSHEDRFAALADTAHQSPDGLPRLRVEARGQLIQKHHFRIVYQRQRDEQPLLLPARKGHEPGVPLVGEPELFQQAVAVHRRRVKRSPEIHRLPDLDPFLKLGLLKLHTDAVLQAVHIAERIQTQDRDDAPVRPCALLRRTPSSWSFQRRWGRSGQRFRLRRLQRETSETATVISVGLTDAGET